MIERSDQPCDLCSEKYYTHYRYTEFHNGENWTCYEFTNTALAHFIEFLTGFAFVVVAWPLVPWLIALVVPMER